jgi:hypothetical protein
MKQGAKLVHRVVADRAVKPYSVRPLKRAHGVEGFPTKVAVDLRYSSCWIDPPAFWKAISKQQEHALDYGNTPVVGFTPRDRALRIIVGFDKAIYLGSRQTVAKASR